MHAEDVLNEPLFCNRQITLPVKASAGSTAQQPLMPQEHTILLTARSEGSARAGCTSAPPATSPHSLPAYSFASDAISMADNCQLSSNTCHMAAGVCSIRRPARHLVVRDVSQRLRLIEAVGGKRPVANWVSLVAPVYCRGQAPIRTQHRLCKGWSLGGQPQQADPADRVRRSSDIPDSQPAWVSPSQRPRLHWSQRQQQQQEQQQQQQQQHQQL